MRRTRWKTWWSTALAARTEHRPDGAQEHTMEILLEYALATSNPLSEHSSDGEVIAIPNTFKEAMESPQAATRKEASDIEMASLENHEVIDLSVFGFNSLGEEGHRDEMGVQGQSRPQTERTSRGSAPGTSAGNRQRLHLRSSVPYPEYPDGPRQCCARKLGSSSSRRPGERSLTQVSKKRYT